MKKWRDILNKLLLYGLFVLGVVLLFFGTGRTSTMVIAFAQFFAGIMLVWLFKLRNVDEKYLTYIYLAFWLNMFGELSIYYEGSMPYDKVLHLSLGILLSAILFEYYKANSILKRDAVFLTVLGMLCLWEIYEYGSDTFFGTQLQGVITNGVWVQSPMDDTMIDLIWGVVGSLAYLFIKKEKLGEFLKKDVKRLQKMAKAQQKKMVTFSQVVKDIFKW